MSLTVAGKTGTPLPRLHNSPHRTVVTDGYYSSNNNNLAKIYILKHSRMGTSPPPPTDGDFYDEWGPSLLGICGDNLRRQMLKTQLLKLYDRFSI